MPETALGARGVTKSFPGVRALDDVTLACAPGRVHALLGENGAGKSTLVRILTGDESPDAGTVVVADRETRLGAPREALGLGIVPVYQELTVLPEMSVLDNVLLGQERSRRGLLDRGAQRELARAALARVSLEDLPLGTRTGELSLANQQLVEIARAIARRSSVLILDEPSAVLSGDKLQALHDVVRAIAAEGTAVVYITHLLEEVPALADDLTVLRDGKVVSSGPATDYTTDRIVREMVGRQVDQVFPDPAPPAGEVVLRVSDLVPVGSSAPPAHLEVRAGEIVGLAGLVGAGRSRFLRTLAGARGRSQGGVDVGGRRVRGSLTGAIAAGVALVPEERKRDGLVLDLTAAQNITLTDLRQVSSAGLVRTARENAAFDEERERLGIKASGPGQPTRQLSGGNQQKIAIAKWLRVSPRVLLLDEPTRGVDIGAKSEIYRIVRELAASGMAIVIASSELAEVIGLAHRVLVFRDGAVVGEVHRDPDSAERIMHLALGTAS
ncbi:sugar ABC transporter ATP-binding protein [Phycicoccus endophyticus]|uniref:Sugar ABC transporter ATP-binding protein n=1 Tax=Phycicoccus endophyticus TaxID=1690220 RepID=A0A7G9R211_9MICO|nr:sugar ABC transporter ATP-binding protein [Phycicoccus endophyticus]NHI19729.1 sugar ABC transporter ATP-binding protein [Phycicoccus endophyticus]QNN49636.1 sugar ABC transporter ATP-binding protein [Phycicoccus endophyticus]GGL33510.1 ribose import ATP-binding protein RbsA 2 [Phycicoccus endophyticus]